MKKATAKTSEHLTAEELLEIFDRVTSGARELMLRKNHDYTGAGGDLFQNFRGSEVYGIDPVVGLLLRMQDKTMRLRTFALRGDLRVVGEGVEDSVRDLINYSVLALGILEERARRSEK